VTRDDKVVITDFGLARQEKAATLTESGALVGTPIYMSPEQIMAKRGSITKLTDVYSMGVTLYQLLTGSPPFSAESTQKILNQILEEEPPALRRGRKKVPPDLSIITLKAMEKEPHSRYESAKDMAEDLRSYMRGSTIKAKPMGMISRVGKRIKRHRFISTLVAIILVLSIGFLIQFILSSQEIEREKEKTHAAIEVQEKERRYNEYVESAKELLAAPHVGDNTLTAINLLKEAIRLLPLQSEARVYLGKAYAHQGDVRRALTEFMVGVENDPGSWNARLERGLFLLEQGRKMNFEKSISQGYQDLEMAFKIDAGNPKTAFHMAQTLYNCSEALDLAPSARSYILNKAYEYALNAQAWGATANIECMTAQICIGLAKYATSEEEKWESLVSADESLKRAMKLDKNHRLAYGLHEEVKKMMEAPRLQTQALNTREMIEEHGQGSFFDRAESIYELLSQGAKDIGDTVNTEETSKLIDDVWNFFVGTEPEAGSVPDDESRVDEKEEFDYPKLLKNASEHLDRKDVTSAVRCYEQALERYPKQAHYLHFMMACAYRGLGTREALETARGHAEAAYGSKPQNGLYLQLLAQILVQLEEKEALEKLTEEAKEKGIFTILGMEFPVLGGKEKESVPH
jgi:tetratricopeptide (TPR) repeat protein